jgi:hypothetical protein
MDRIDSPHTSLGPKGRGFAAFRRGRRCNRAIAPWGDSAALVGDAAKAQKANKFIKRGTKN